MKLLVRKLSLVIGVALIVFVLNLFLGDAFAAHISNWNWVRKYHLVEPRAPLVINTREEVRVNEANDIISVLNRSRNKVAAIVDTSTGSSQLRAAALAVTADGIFLTEKSALGSNLNALQVVLSDGKRLKITSASLDPLTGLAAIQTDGAGLSVASFMARQDMTAGKRVVLLASNPDGSPYFLASFLSSGELLPITVLSSDSPARTLPMQSVPGIIPGQTILDLSGQVAGLWDGQKVVPASVLAEAVSNLLAHGGKITHPIFGFNYRFIASNNTGSSNGSRAGFLVSRSSEGGQAVLTGTPAAKAGLLEGDIIVRINGQEVATQGMPETLLTAVTSGNKVTFEIYRGEKSLQLEITPN